METLLNLSGSDWEQTFSLAVQQQAQASLEQGKIIHFPALSFQLSHDETLFLSPTFADSNVKNISFNLHTDCLQGTTCQPTLSLQLKKMLLRYAQHTQVLLSHLYPSYITDIKIGRTSFRPVEIEGRRPSSYRKDDTRLHVDAFPASPTQGKRILRIFSNINPHGQSRVWRVGEPFLQVAQQFLPTTRRSWLGRSALLHWCRFTKSYCTEYDYRMLQIHNNMKADLAYQKKASQAEILFAPGTTWIVQTDQVSHAAMKGQYVLEQTFYLPVTAMGDPSCSPLYILENLIGQKLIA